MVIAPACGNIRPRVTINILKVCHALKFSVLHPKWASWTFNRVFTFRGWSFSKFSTTAQWFFSGNILQRLIYIMFHRVILCIFCFFLFTIWKISYFNIFCIFVTYVQICDQATIVNCTMSSPSPTNFILLLLIIT